MRPIRLVIALLVALTAALSATRAEATPAPAPTCPVAITYTVTAQWTTGFVAQFTLRNITTETIGPNWTLTWTFTNGEVVNAGFTGMWRQVGPDVTVTGPYWAPPIPPGASVGVGFAASGRPGRPSNVRFNGIPCQLTA